MFERQGQWNKTSSIPSISGITNLFQALYETQFSNGWVNVGPKIVLEEAQARVKRDGWEGKPDAMGMPKGGVRQAMGSQVRCALNCLLNFFPLNITM